MTRPERPSAVLVVAILQICFGSLGLLGNLCCGGLQLAGGSMAFAPPPGAQALPDVDAIMRAKLPHYAAMQYGGLALGLIAGTVMLVGGIGLLRMRPWARWLSIGYACYNIVSSIIGFIFTLTVTLPAMREVLAEPLPQQAFSAMSMAEAMTTLILYGSLVLLVYPIALLIVMFLPHVREPFRAQTAGPADEDFEDDDFDDEDAPAAGGAPPLQKPDAAREEGIQPGDEPRER
jgi:hypothetical protein